MCKCLQPVLRIHINKCKSKGHDAIRAQPVLSSAQLDISHGKGLETLENHFMSNDTVYEIAFFAVRM